MSRVTSYQPRQYGNYIIQLSCHWGTIPGTHHLKEETFNWAHILKEIRSMVFWLPGTNIMAGGHGRGKLFSSWCQESREKRELYPPEMCPQ